MPHFNCDDNMDIEIEFYDEAMDITESKKVKFSSCIDIVEAYPSILENDVSPKVNIQDFSFATSIKSFVDASSCNPQLNGNGVTMVEDTMSFFNVGHEEAMEVAETIEINFNGSNDFVADCSNSSKTSYEDETSFNFQGRGSRKRKINSKRWQQKKRKEKKNSGVSYLTKKGLVVAKKSVIGKIESCCKLKCFSKFEEGDLQKINKDYWALGVFNRQRDFINFHVKSIPCQRSQSKGSKRKNTFNYQLSEKKFVKHCF